MERTTVTGKLGVEEARRTRPAKLKQNPTIGFSMEPRTIYYTDEQLDKNNTLSLHDQRIFYCHPYVFGAIRHTIEHTQNKGTKRHTSRFLA